MCQRNDRQLSVGVVSRMALACGLLLGAGLPGMPLEATPIYYIGVGNNTPGDPDGAAADKLKSTLAKAAQATGKQLVANVLHPQKDANGNTVEVGKDRITQAFQNTVPNLRDGDVVVFYYVGHGGTISFEEGKEDAQDATDHAKTKGNEFLGADGNVLLDDALADLMAAIPASIPKVVIGDTCCSGGWVGGANDLDRASMRNLLYLLSVPEQALDQGLYDYSIPLAEAFGKNPATGKRNADKNKDGNVTLSEWLNYADEARIAKQYGSGGCSCTLRQGSDPRDYVIFPEPSSLAILGLGLACAAVRRRPPSVE